MNQAAQTAKRSPQFAVTCAAIAKRRGTKIATIAIARKLLTRAWHLLATQASTPAVRAAPAATTARPGGSPSPGHARSSGMRRPPAALDHLTEQPGPRTHGHGDRAPARRRMGACQTTPPATPGTAPEPSQTQHEGTFPAPHDPSPLAGVQLVRPRRRAAAGTPARPLPHGDVNQAAARTIQTNSQAQPGDTTQAAGSMSYTLLTPMALMGAAYRASAPACPMGLDRSSVLR